MRLIFETVSEECEIYTLGFDLETDTYDEVVRTIDYFRHIYTLDAYREDYIKRCIELVEKEVSGKATLRDTQEFDRLDKARDQAGSFLGKKTTVILMRGHLKDTILTLEGGCEKCGDLDWIAKNIAIPPQVEPFLPTINLAWKAAKPPVETAPTALQRAAQKLQAKPEVKADAPDIAHDIDVDDLPLEATLAAIPSSKQNVPLKITPSKAKKGQAKQ